MCGIAGALSFASSTFAVTEPWLVAMRDTMVHRGPDSAGLWIAADRKVGLAFRRLAIIDLSEAANQPMQSADGRFHLVFNGEIYNHADIRAELKALGRTRWKTDHSDSEVILQAFAEWGIEAIERFRGMFAIGLWDAGERELWLVRDRIGVKPLYWSVHHGRLTFASEIKALLRDPEQPRALHEEAFHDFLSFLTTPAPQTIFHGIRKLPCGSWLRVKADGTIEERKWWDVLERTRPLPAMNDDEIAARVLAELRESVRLRKVSDVPVGVFLSGGVDSSTNAALFSEGETGKLNTFSIGYDRDYPSYRNELEYARMVARQVGAHHHEKLLTVDDLLDFIPRMVALQDEPIADPVCVPLYYVSKLARDAGVIVCHVGEGADELFCGYPYWRVAAGLERASRLPVPEALKRLGMGALGLAGRGDKRETEFLRRSAEGVPVFWGGAEAFTEAEKRSFLSKRLLARLGDRTSWEALRPIHARFQEKAWERSPLAWMTYLDLNLRLPELLLMRVDKMSMGVSLEARVPFLDHRFVELAMAIPEAVKTRHGTLKHLLKKAVRGLVPDVVLTRPKAGFGVPLAEWYVDRLGEQVRGEVRAFARRTDVFDPAGIERAFERIPPKRLWYLYNFALWWAEYLDA